MYSEPKIYVRQSRGYPTAVAWEEIGDATWVKGFYKEEPEPTIGILPLDEQVDGDCYPVYSYSRYSSQRGFAVGWASYEVGTAIQPGTYDFTYDEETGLWTFTPDFCEPEAP